MTHQAQFEHWVPFPIERVFLFFANPENLPRLMPPDIDTRIHELQLEPPPLLPFDHSRAKSLAGIGSEIYTSFRVLPLLPFRIHWISRITEFEWNHHFVDVQVKGPFDSCHHRHEFAPDIRDGAQGTMVCDRIEYSVGYGPLGATANNLFVARQLRQTFVCRQRTLPRLFDTQSSRAK